MEVTVVDTTRNFFNQGMNAYSPLAKSSVNLEQALANAAGRKAADTGIGQDSVTLSPQALDLARGAVPDKVFSKEESAQIIERMKPSAPPPLGQEFLEKAMQNLQEALNKNAEMEAQQAELEARRPQFWDNLDLRLAREREQAEGIDGSSLESPILSTGELTGPVSVTTKNGTRVDIFSRSPEGEGKGPDSLFAALSFSDGTRQEFELRYNTVFSEDENGNMFMFVNDDNELYGSEGDDIIINFSAGQVSAKGGNDTVLNFNHLVESLDGGSGDDIIYAGELNRAKVSGGQGNDTLVASNTSRSTTIDMGDGDDTVQVRNLESSVNLGNGNNTLRAATLGVGSGSYEKEFTISGGDGHDVISIGAMGGLGGVFTIDMGEGDNTLNIKDIGFTNGMQIRAGNGNNSIDIGKMKTHDKMYRQSALYSQDALNLGDGNNNIHIGRLSGTSNMVFGNGNNTLSIDEMKESHVIGMELDGKYMVSRMAYEFVFGDGNNNFNVTKLLESRVRFGSGANAITGESIERSIISASDQSIHDSSAPKKKFEYPL